MEEIALTVEPRTERGKGPARRARAAGAIPGIFYGPSTETIPFTVSGKEFATHVGSLEGSHLIRLESSAPELQRRVALLREVQTHPVTGTILHVDLYEVDLTQRLTATVPLRFVGRARGVAEGGILQPILREIEVECLPTDIPTFVEVDVTNLAIHDAVHLAEIQLPANVSAVFETNDAVVTVLPPTVEEVKVTEAVEGAAVEGAAPTEAEGKEGKESGKGS